MRHQAHFRQSRQATTTQAQASVHAATPTQKRFGRHGGQAPHDDHHQPKFTTVEALAWAGVGSALIYTLMSLHGGLAFHSPLAGFGCLLLGLGFLKRMMGH